MNYGDPAPVRTDYLSTFYRHLAFLAPGAIVNAVTIRDDVVSAGQIPSARLGALFGAAARDGLILPRGYIRVYGERSRGHLARSWVRSNKPILIEE